MTNEEILKRAIDKAYGEGKFDDLFPNLTVKNDDIEIQEILQAYVRIKYAPIYIFSHEFAKAFFGETEVELAWSDYKHNHKAFGGILDYPYEEGASISYTAKAHVYHLQQMVISEDPIKYLEQYL